MKMKHKDKTMRTGHSCPSCGEDWCMEQIKVPDLHGMYAYFPLECSKCSAVYVEIYKLVGVKEPSELDEIYSDEECMRLIETGQKEWTI